MLSSRRQLLIYMIFIAFSGIYILFAQYIYTSVNLKARLSHSTLLVQQELRTIQGVLPQKSDLYRNHSFVVNLGLLHLYTGNLN
jgi:hypothetical protein